MSRYWRVHRRNWGPVARDRKRHPMMVIRMPEVSQADRDRFAAALRSIGSETVVVMPPFTADRIEWVERSRKRRGS